MSILDALAWFDGATFGLVMVACIGGIILLACHDCGGSAAQWSYDHSDKSAVEEEVNGRLVVYSADICHYMPRCIPCHIEFDRRH